MNGKQQRLLASVLARVPYDGWTILAIAKGAKVAGFSPAEAQACFPDGVAGVVAAFHAMINNTMRAAIKGNRKFAVLRTRDKVAFAVRARLEAVDDYREAMQRLLVWGVMPRNIRAASGHLWQAADEVWRAAGDTSTDYNYYTKRILLIAVMKATLSFWLNDVSPECRDTWEFLDRRIGNVLTVGKGIGVAKTVGVEDILSFVRSRFAH